MGALVIAFREIQTPKFETIITKDRYSLQIFIVLPTTLSMLVYRQICPSSKYFLLKSIYNIMEINFRAYNDLLIVFVD